MPRILIIEDEPGAKYALRSVLVKRMTVNGLRSAHCAFEDTEDIEEVKDTLVEALSGYRAALFHFLFEGLQNPHFYIDGVLEYLWDVLTYLLDQQGKLSQSALLEQLKCKDKIKALHKPLNIIPQSLHPAHSVAL